MPGAGIVKKEYTTDLVEALTEGSNEEELQYIRQHGILLLLEIATFLAEIHSDNSYFSQLIAKSIAALTQAHAFFASGIPVGDADFAEHNYFNPWLPNRAICVKLRAFPDKVVKRKG